jgi:hypothetical protein
MGSPTTLTGFAEQYRLRVNLDRCRDRIIRGKFGHLYEHDARRLGIVLEAPPDDASSDRTLRVRKRRAIAAGFLPHQEGDFEAILLFDPTDAKQAGLAIRLIHAKKIRQAARPTDAQLRARVLFSSKVRPRRPCLSQNTNAVLRQGGWKMKPTIRAVGWGGVPNLVFASAHASAAIDSMGDDSSQRIPCSM